MALVKCNNSLAWSKQNFGLSSTSVADSHLHVVTGELSSGEVQRLQLARVLHQCPALLIIDEGSNAVEPSAELDIYNALEVSGVAVIATAQVDSRAKHLFNKHVQLPAM